MTDLAARFRFARSSKGLSQALLAKRLGIHRSAIAQWERGVSPTMPSLSHLIQASAILGVSFDWLATGKGPPVIAEAEAQGTPKEALSQLSDIELRVVTALRKASIKDQMSLCKFIEGMTR